MKSVTILSQSPNSTCPRWKLGFSYTLLITEHWTRCDCLRQTEEKSLNPIFIAFSWNTTSLMSSVWKIFGCTEEIHTIQSCISHTSLYGSCCNFCTLQTQTNLAVTLSMKGFVKFIISPIQKVASMGFYL